MMLRVIHLLLPRLWLAIIYGEAGEYLSRYLLRGRLNFDDVRTPYARECIETPAELRRPCRWSLYLHRFHQPDVDRALHSHPWAWSLSFVLAGGYVEERLIDGEVVTREIRPFTFNWFGKDAFHRVSELRGKETWTLFLVGSKAQSWGFLVDGTYIPWRDYLRTRGLL
jgi:hypothetical protein